MLTYVEDPERGIVELTIDGKVDRASFEDVVLRLGPLMEQHGKVGVLKRVVAFSGMSPSVFWDDLKFGFRHLKHVGPVAVVTDKDWVEAWTKLAAPFFESDVRVFEEDEIEEARDWLRRATAKVKAAAAGG